MTALVITGYASLDYSIAVSGKIRRDQTTRISSRDPQAWPRLGGSPAYVGAAALAGGMDAVSAVLGRRRHRRRHIQAQDYRSGAFDCRNSRHEGRALASLHPRSRGYWWNCLPVRSRHADEGSAFRNATVAPARCRARLCHGGAGAPCERDTRTVSCLRQALLDCQERSGCLSGQRPATRLAREPVSSFSMQLSAP